MVLRTKIIAIGDSAGNILPQEIPARLNLKEDDSLHFREIPGGYEISPIDQETVAKMEGVDRASSRYQDALKKLAE